MRSLSKMLIAIVAMSGLAACTNDPYSMGFNSMNPQSNMIGGALLGAGTGAAIGAIAGHGEGAAIGSIIGMGVGALAGRAVTPMAAYGGGGYVGPMAYAVPAYPPVYPSNYPPPGYYPPAY